MWWLIDYLEWHYTKALGNFIKILYTGVVFLYHFFSISLLIKTFFTPWRRQNVKVEDVFPLGPFFEAVTFNLVSRTIGFIVRLITIGVGLSTLAIGLCLSAVAVFVWICIPFGSLPLYVWSRRQTLLGHLKEDNHTMKEVFFHLFDTNMGRYVIRRLNIAPDKLFASLSTAYDAALPAGFAQTSHLSDALAMVTHHWLAFRTTLEKEKIPLDDIAKIARWYEREQETIATSHRFWDPDVLWRIPGIGHTWSYGYTVNLDRYTYSFSARENPLGRLHGREKELHQMELILSKLVQNSILVIGESGVARHPTIEALGDMITSGYTLPNLRNKRMLGFNLDLFLSEHASTAGQSGEVAKLIEEAQTAGNIILVIDHIDQYLGKNATPNLAETFNQALSSGRLQIIGITQTKAYHECIEDTSVMKNFTTISLEAVDASDMMPILEDIVPHFEFRYGVFFTYTAMKEIIHACTRLFPSVPFPQKAIDALETICAHASDQKLAPPLTADIVDTVLSQSSNIPFGKVGKDEARALLGLEKFLHSRVIGQDQAVSVLTHALQRKRLGLKESQKPIGSFLFLGPTGVGKTETAKALSSIYFGSEERMVRLDMSQFQDDEAIYRLIGSGNGQVGQLTSKIRENPFSTVLLDEFEKGSEKIRNLFLTVFDEGYLTDGNANKVYFTNTIIIATSNAGAEFIREKIMLGVPLGDLTQQLTEKILTENMFTPELINRFDAIVVFKPLNVDQLRQIAHLQLMQLSNQLKQTHGISIDISDELINHIATLGFDPTFGARPMRRLIQEKVEDVIAQKLLTGDVRRGEAVAIPL